MRNPENRKKKNGGGELEGKTSRSGVLYFVYIFF